MWHAQGIGFMSAVVAQLYLAPAFAQESLRELPLPIRTYADQFAPYCTALGRPGVITNEMYRDSLFGAPDINDDGEPDYFQYKCMFGCQGLPFAFTGLGLPCPFGSLLLSSANGYQAVSIPGTITRLDFGPPLKIAVTRFRVYPADCDNKYVCDYLFELREGRFQLITPCPQSGCELQLSATQ
jgi:hypothetical protein